MKRRIFIILSTNYFLIVIYYLKLGRGNFRLASGYSDAFDDLIDSAHTIFNANELMAAIDQLPSEESDRPITPEEPLPMPAPLKTCYACGCQCQLLGLKWRFVLRRRLRH